MATHATTVGEEPTSDDKMFGLLAHVLGMITWLLGPVVLMLVFADKPFVKYHATQALVMGVVNLIGFILVSIISTITCGIGAVLYLLLIPLWFVPLYGMFQGWNGKWDCYPGLSGFGK